MPDIVVRMNDKGDGVSLDVHFENLEDASQIVVRGAITAGQKTYTSLGMSFEVGYDGPEPADPWTCVDVMMMEKHDLGDRKLHLRNDSFFTHLLQFAAIAWLQEKILKREDQELEAEA